MKNPAHDQKTEKASNWIAVIANITQILSFLFSLLTAFVLVKQDKPVQIPGIDVKFDPFLEMLFVFSILLSYTVYIRQRLEKQRKAEVKTANKRRYLFEEMVVRKPIYVVPYLFLFYVWFKIPSPFVYLMGTVPDEVYQYRLDNLMILLGVIFFLLLVLDFEFVTYVPPHLKGNVILKDKEKWMRRIRKRLVETGSVTTNDLLAPDPQLPQGDYRVVNEAIRIYFDAFQDDEDLQLLRVQNKWSFEPYYRIVYRVQAHGNPTINPSHVDQQ